MFKKLLLLLAVVSGLVTPTLAATSTYTVYPTAGSIVCGSDAVCSTIKHLSVQTVTVSGTAGTALYTWNASCPSSPDAIFYIRPTGATTGCFVLEGFGSSTGGVTALAGTTNQITVSASTGSVTLSLSSTLIAPGTFSSTSLNVSGSTPSVNGLYLPSANTLGVSVNSIQVGRFTSTGLNATNIGVTTPGSGSFTTVLASGAITPSQTAGIVGTTTNNNANAGSVGEFLSAQTPISGSTACPSSGTVANMNVGITLTPGDWDVYGNFYFGATTVAAAASSISTTTGALDPAEFRTDITPTSSATVIGDTVPYRRLSVSSNTPIFIVVRVFYTGSCLMAGGIYARRAR